MYQPIHLRTRILVSLISSIALAWVPAIAHAGKKGQSRGFGGQFSQPNQGPVARPAATPRPTATPKPTNTGKSTTTGKPKITDEPKITGKSKITDEPRIRGESQISNEPKITGKHKEARSGKGKLTTTAVTSEKATNTTDKSAVADKTPIPASVVSAPTATPTQQSSVIPIPSQPAQQFSVDPNVSQPTQQPSSVPITDQSTQLSVNPNPVQSTQQLSVGSGPSQPTTTSTPLTVHVTQLPTPPPNQTTTQTSVVVPITNMPAQQINVGPNTNNPTQSAISVSGSNAVANQQTGTAPTGIQGQIVTGVAPSATPFRAAAPLQVSGQVGATTPDTSGFNSVSVTNPNPPTSYGGWYGKPYTDPTNFYLRPSDASLFHMDPNAAVLQTQRSDQNGD